jgi:uncharacterized protein
MSELEEQTIYTCLTQCRNIALVGVSPKQELAAHEVMQYLLQHNYKVFPINPKYQGEDILGQKVYADILDVPEVIDMIDVFRPSREALEVTKNTLRLVAARYRKPRGKKNCRRQRNCYDYESMYINRA